MLFTLLIPYIVTILVATVVAIVRTRGFYPAIPRKENPEAWDHYYGMLFLTSYLAINLVTETVGVIMARNNFYNHYLYAINILLTQLTLVACFCYFTRLNRLMIAYGVLMLSLSLYIYADNAYWRPDTVMPQSVYMRVTLPWCP
ncbi:hypothetical protein [Niabella hibiscisoli]|uniref:hypothetical protein n=1 Tax=Niabella hibiscisoli TaxID=1825928 RepID=UPI001F10B95C|nr:hypothetical protein [Niabella hibiscisoli]MCH5720761.1 hypothetical protein [Niabella hibiscisoli]